MSSPNLQSATNGGNRASSRINSLQLNVQNLLHGSPLRSPMRNFAGPRLPRPGFLKNRREQDEENVTLTRPSTDVTPQLATPTSRFTPESAADNRPSDVSSVAAPLPDGQTDVNPSTWQGTSNEDERITATRSELDHQRVFTQKMKKRQKSAWIRNKADRPKFFSCIGNSSPRRKFIMCAISGSLLTITLTTYLGVALTAKSLSQPVHVIFILVILLITVFFCHSLIRLCMHLLRPSSAARSRSRIPSISSRDGFNPNEPIRVHVVTDEEIAGADNEECRMVRDSKGLVAPPPAYGLWRSSVRVNPNLLHWQRTQEPTNVETHEPPAQASTGGGIVRPPSYLSDDGVEYVLHAAPRSTVPTMPISQSRRDETSSIGRTTAAAATTTAATTTISDGATQGMAQLLQDEHQFYQEQSQQRSHIAQSLSTVAVPLEPLPPPPPPVPTPGPAIGPVLASYTPYTASSIYSEHTPPVVQAPDFGASLVEQMLLHPAYRT